MDSLSKPRAGSKPPRHVARRVVFGAVGAAGLALLLIVAVSMSGCCERYFYYPTADVYSTPRDYGLAFEQVEFRSKDGTRLAGWFIPAVGGAGGTVVHCHGNAENMTSHWQFARFLPGRGLNLFVFDYRGYGESEGRPTRRGTVEDAQAAVDYVCGRNDVDAGRVALFGQSLGGSIATVVAARDKRVRGLVIDSAFSSYRGEAAHQLRAGLLTRPFARLFSRLFVRSGFDAIDHVAGISPRPILIIHGTADRVVPASMSRALAEKAGEPKELWLVNGADHLAASRDERQKFESKVCDLFERAFK